MTDDEYEEDKTINVNLSLPDEIEIDHGLVSPLLILCIAVGSLFTSYDNEIRCALGNKQVCAKMEVIQPAKAQDK